MKQYIEALQELFGGEWEATVAGQTMCLMSPKKGLVCDSPTICHLIDEALLKREDVYAVNVRRDKSGQCYIELDADEGCWQWQSIKADYGDQLTARLEAITKLKL